MPLVPPLDIDDVLPLVPIVPPLDVDGVPPLVLAVPSSRQLALASQP
jgi:hypothetical protein